VVHGARPWPDGFLQQHVLEATLPDGTKPGPCTPAWSSPCANGKVTRLDEYLDSAQAGKLRAFGR
jgi:hypothetical protein